MSFIIVKYGKEQEHIFNANCKSINLINSIKEVCGYNDLNVNEIDLAEESTGQPAALNTTPYEYANTNLQARGVYVLISVHKDEHGHVEYVPLIDSKSNFVVKLKSPRKTKEETKKKMDRTESQKFKQVGAGNAPRRSIKPAENSLTATTTQTTTAKKSPSVASQ
eukprot:TRINITY_DN2311_c0_g1_i1.p1 TRINITY_DN2311_c0_g1~~TRINITY_DN2311_c0_g1_i1.p1  ORF type:complete len:165 (-),score=41.54 TRINITY_DN2311_c0_g1_i1:248-742(-)